MSDQDKKDIRRQNQFLNKNKQKPKISEEQRYISKSKKQLKNKIKEIQAEEIWEDWEQDFQ
jgi:hypothetical protein